MASSSLKSSTLFMILISGIKEAFILILIESCFNEMKVKFVKDIRSILSVNIQFADKDNPQRFPHAEIILR